MHKSKRTENTGECEYECKFTNVHENKYSQVYMNLNIQVTQQKKTKCTLHKRLSEQHIKCLWK